MKTHSTVVGNLNCPQWATIMIATRASTTYLVLALKLNATLKSKTEVLDEVL